MQKLFFVILYCLWAPVAAFAQQQAINFHKLSPQQGLHDGIVRSITQDKYGYMWIGTAGALNRYDGNTVKQFTNIPGDSTSPYVGQPRSIHTDKQGNLWIGYELGLLQYQYSTSTFKRVPALKDHHISSITSAGDSLLLLCTNRGFVRYNINTGSPLNYTRSNEQRFQLLRSTRVNEAFVQENKAWLATQRGVLIFDLVANTVDTLSIPLLKGISIAKISRDKNNNTWLGTFSDIKLVKLHADNVTTSIYDQYLSSSIYTQPENINNIFCDSKNRVWVCTSIDGLLQYDAVHDSFIKHVHSDFFTTGPSVNFFNSIFEDRAGTIWLGAVSFGVNYFEPDKNLFQTILPFADSISVRQRAVGRAVTEDKDGNLWMGNHDGVSRYNFKTGQYTSWRNEVGKKPLLHNNQVRSICCDANNDVWIGTSSGVNKFVAASQQMTFVSSSDLPLSFYNSITQDRSGNVWFCTNDTATVYWYSLVQKKFDNISHHPQLKKFKGTAPTSYVMEDSKHRLWISLARKGVLMLDKNSGQTKVYNSGDNPLNNLAGNAIMDIKEDKKGIIWVSSFNGVSGIDVDHNTIQSFDNKTGLPGNWVGPLVIDNNNRLWMGVNGGLTMLDADRKHFNIFSLNDGLSSVGFPEHAGITLSTGEIVFPSNNGFVIFNPANFKAGSGAFPFYLAGYSLQDKFYEYHVSDDNEARLNLPAKQNSISLQIAALNYLSPEKTWYAYKLEGFDDDWNYTQDAKAVYTNLPGGHYTFLYKAALSNTDWDKIAEKRFEIKLQTVFYKTWWFISLMLLAIASFVVWLYRYRLKQKENLMLLKGKAQLLEKEKAMVMYEGLKQQLNPHFLFNSLTSLGGLIETNPTVAISFLQQMSGIYRYILKNDNTESVLLKDEIAFARLYIDLQKTRFKKGFQVEIDIPEEYLHYRIAPVTLQNLIENAIKHNIIDEQSPLIIRIFIEGDYIIVKNNLQKKNNVETSNKRGLVQFINLYTYLSTTAVQVAETADSFIVKVPLI